MKSMVRSLASFAMMLAFVAVAAAQQRQETRAVSGFTSISLSAPINVELVQGDTEGMALDGDAAALADLETVVEHGSLKIRTLSYFEVPGMQKVHARISVKSIDALAIAGSGDIKSMALKCNDLKISIAGSGDVRIQALTASDLHVSIAGSGDALLGGKVDTVSTSIAGSGDMKAAKLESRQSKVSIAGSGDAMLWAREQISVSIMGSGDVRYYGDPTIKSSILGSGSVKRVAAAPS